MHISSETDRQTDGETEKETDTTVNIYPYPSPVQPGSNSLILMRRAVTCVVLLEPHHGAVAVKGRGKEQQLTCVEGKQERTGTERCHDLLSQPPVIQKTSRSLIQLALRL